MNRQIAIQRTAPLAVPVSVANDICYKALFLLSVQVLSSSSGPPPVGDDTLSQLLPGHSITDEQFVRVSMEQMKQWTNYLSVSVTETLKRRRRQIKNRHYQAMFRRRKQQRGSPSFESHVSEIVPSKNMAVRAYHDIYAATRTYVPQTIQNQEPYRWSRAQTIQVWTGIFFRTMIKTIKHIGHKTSISVGRLDAAQNVQLSRRET